MDSNPGRKKTIGYNCWPIHCVDILLQPRPLQAGAAHRPPLPLLLPPPAVEKQHHHHDYSWSWSSLLQITTIAFTNKTRNIIIVYYCRFTVQGHRWSSGNSGAKETFQYMAQDGGRVRRSNNASTSHPALDPVTAGSFLQLVHSNGLIWWCVFPALNNFFRGDFLGS